ncbi:hypothetical protein CLOP_g24451, partial [Closterium sp. NIES-67]
LNRHANARVRS